MAGDGIAASTFHDMFNEALADAMAEGGGVGLAGQIVAQLGGPGAAPGPGAVPPAMVLRAYAGPLTVAPVLGTLTSGEGIRHDPGDGKLRQHNGLDIAVPMGTPVRAAGGGTVSRAGVAGGYGNLVVVDHGGGLETRYAHLSHIDVRVGDPIAPGMVVGEVGSTGRSLGPHLHFEVRRDGEVMDPLAEMPELDQALKHRR
ncbi:MAG: peptidoglycan DD-metalloendopeptidase family protein [Kofleriaceae bacterium]|nr:peptidoglycan DD-metalloendopeptidase family protein [Kofleriaceae bacterium]MCB9574572.1 peptidoglycan DD-metalloendopeptidase family protein [Kofleriaceae bacterium]